MILKIYDEWVSLRTSLGKRKSKLTPKRKGILSQVLSRHNAEEISMVLKYIGKADDHYARFMRGDNDNQKDYTSFDSIFRPTKIEDKIKKAQVWSDNNISYSNETYFPFTVVG